MLQKNLEIVKTALEDLKAVNLVTLDVASLTPFVSQMFICTGTSSRHVKSLADNVERLAKEYHLPVFGYEGNALSDWILVDLGEIVVHVMQQEARDFYDLESLWGNFAELNLDPAYAC